MEKSVEIKLKSWEIKADFLEIKLGNQPNPPAPPTFTTYHVIFEGNQREIRKSRTLKLLVADPSVRANATKSCTITFGSSSIMRAKSNRFLLLLLASWFAVSVTTAQMRLNVFRGTLVHSRVRTEMEVLPDHVIGIDVNDLGRVRLHVVSNSTITINSGLGSSGTV